MDVRGFGEVFKYVVFVVGVLGYMIEDIFIVIGLMSNVGIKGEKVGIVLWIMFINFLSLIRVMGNEMECLGIFIIDSNGKMIFMWKFLD